MGGTDLGPRYQHAEVAALAYVARLDRDCEARPAGVAVELADRGKQRLAGHDVNVYAGVLVVPVIGSPLPHGASGLPEEDFSFEAVRIAEEDAERSTEIVDRAVACSAIDEPLPDYLEGLGGGGS